MNDDDNGEKEKGGARGRADERAAIYDRRIADRVAFKIDPVFRNREDPRSHPGPCLASLLSRSPSCGFAVVCAPYALCYFRW